MIIAFESRESAALNKFVDSFIEPPGLWDRFRHVYEFTSKSFRRIDNIYVFQFDSFLALIGKQVLIGSIFLFLVSYLLHWNFLSVTSVVLILMALILVSKSVKQLTFLLKLKRAGHKFKITFISNDFLLNKLLLESKHGSE